MLESFHLDVTFCVDFNITYGIEIGESVGEHQKKRIPTIEGKRTEHTQSYRARIQTIYSGLLLISDNLIF